MEIYYTLKAQSDLENLPKDTQERIAHKMRFYAFQKDPIKFAKKLIDSRDFVIEPDRLEIVYCEKYYQQEVA